MRRQIEVVRRQVKIPSGFVDLCIRLDRQGAIEAIVVTVPGVPASPEERAAMDASSEMLVGILHKAGRMEKTPRDVAGLFPEGTPSQVFLSAIADVQEQVLAERLSGFGRRVV